MWSLARDFDGYLGLGFDPVTVAPETKKPYLKRWPKLLPEVMLQRAHDDDLLGLRGGGDVQAAFLDCDERKRPGTFTTAQRWLAGLGYMPDGDYPVVQSASGIGRHIYASFGGGLPGHYRNLASDFGAGEFRFGPAALVVAPPSRVGDGAYTLLQGDFRQLPKLELADVLPILKNQDLTPETHQAALPTVPRSAADLLAGRGLDAYPTRSEAEQAIIAGLVNAGYDFGGVLALFLGHPAAGKFAELRAKSEREAIAWLRRSFDKAKSFVTSHPSEGRQVAVAALQWAQSRPWPGRTGLTDHAIFTAHASIAKRAGALIYAASVRDLAEMAGVSRLTAQKANRRLVTVGLLEAAKAAVADRAGLWRLPKCGEYTTSTHGGYEEVVYFPHFGEMRPPFAHDAFRRLRRVRVKNADRRRTKSEVVDSAVPGARAVEVLSPLGKTSAELWALLRERPMTARELAERSGRCRRTVYDNLAKLARIVDPATGEVFRLVEPGDGDTWRALDCDLDAIARAIGTAGIGKRQHERHERERRAYKGLIDAWKEKHP